MKLIGLSAKSGHGKDYCAQVIVNLARKEFGLNLGIYSFALPLKALIVGENTNISYEDVFVTKPPIIRELLQRRGTEQGRNVFGEDIWIRMGEVILNYMSINTSLDGFIIPDVRFPNEADFSKKHGFCLRITSDRPTLVGDAAKHSSETALDDYKFDAPINNAKGVTNEALERDFIPYITRLFDISGA